MFVRVMEELKDKYSWGTKPPGRWWNIKNHDEMREYVRETIPEMIYNDEFLEMLVEIQMKTLIEERLRLMALNKQHDA